MGQREDLESLRVTLFAALDEAKADVKAQVAGQLRQVIKDLASLGEEKAEVSVADEIAARRSARGAGTGSPASSARRGQSRRGGGSNRAG